jgi:L-lactate dehydrogenase (cytochrome)
MLKRIFFRPRVMRDVSTVDLSSSMLGIPMSMPLFICPTGVARLIHPDAEKALARAAGNTGILEVISTNSGHPLKEVVAEAPEYPFFFQLYLNKDREKSREILRKVESLGLKAIWLTVDAAGRGKRESDERVKSDETVIDPVTGKPVKATGGLTRVMGSYIDQSMTWDAIAWIRSVTNLPIILKGITSAADAKIALEHNVQGIVVSNHGGRNLDYSPPSILVLLEMHRACPEVFDKMEVYIDGGFRRGSDILKALCLGAKAVGIGRSFLYALQYGTEGAEHLVQRESHRLVLGYVFIVGILIQLPYSAARRDGKCHEAAGCQESVGSTSWACEYVRRRLLGSFWAEPSIYKVEVPSASLG